MAFWPFWWEISQVLHAVEPAGAAPHREVSQGSKGAVP